MNDFAEHAFRPHPWQFEPWACTNPVMLLTGSAGGGKSKLASEKLHAFCQRYPGAMALAARKTRESMLNSTVLQIERDVIGPDPHVRHLHSAHRFEYANGSILAYGGMADEAQREQIRSIGQQGGLDIAWLEEANRFTQDDFNEILPRMRGRAAPWRQIILTTNPDAWTHWINQRLILGHGATVYFSHASDNPTNPDDYANTLDSLTGIMRTRLRDGIWRQAQGVVYDEWAPAVHLVDNQGPWKRTYAGVDEGYTNPAVILVIGEDGDGRKHAITEFYASRILQDDLVAAADTLALRYAIETFYVDPSAAGLIAALRAANLRVIEANNDVTDGISTVKSQLRPAADAQGKLTPRLTFSELCVNTLREIETYAWDETTLRIKETPIKANDHAMDALRYALHTQAPVTTGHVIEFPPPKILQAKDLPFANIPI